MKHTQKQMLFVLLAGLLLMGCAKQKPQPETQMQTAVQTQPVRKAADEAPLFRPEYELSEQVYTELQSGFSHNGHEYFRSLSKENGKYGLIDETGAYVLKPEFDCLMRGEETVFGYCLGPDGYRNRVYDYDLNLLYDEVNPTYRARCCAEGVLSMIDDDRQHTTFIYRRLDAEPGELMNPADTYGMYAQGGIFINGYAPVLAADRPGDILLNYYMDRDGEFHMLVYQPYNKGVAVPMSPMAADGYGLYPIEKDGWVLYNIADAFNPILGIKNHADDFGFYNVNSREFRTFLPGYGRDYQWHTQQGKINNDYHFVHDGYVLWGSLNPADPGVPERRVYDLAEEKFVTEKSYRQIELKDIQNGSGHILVQTLDGTWGYLDYQFRPERFYDDASNFRGGIALIVQDGQTAVIDEKLREVSDFFPGDGVSMLHESASHVYAAVHDPKANGFRILKVQKQAESKAQAGETDPNLKALAGTYTLTDMKEDGDALKSGPEVDTETVMKRTRLELFADGTGRLVSDTQILSLTWDPEKLVCDDEELPFTAENGEIRVSLESSYGILEMTFRAK